MREIVLISLIFFFLQSCGKKDNPEYNAMKIEQNNTVSLKT
tara:strand:- start:941 stop:1063 length:123 start_codon:yes stop_codon:yes gene_type:complete